MVPALWLQPIRKCLHLHSLPHCSPSAKLQPLLTKLNLSRGCLPPRNQIDNSSNKRRKRLDQLTHTTCCQLIVAWMVYQYVMQVVDKQTIRQACWRWSYYSFDSGEFLQTTIQFWWQVRISCSSWIEVSIAHIWYRHYPIQLYIYMQCFAPYIYMYGRWHVKRSSAFSHPISCMYHVTNTCVPVTQCGRKKSEVM